MKNYSDKTKIIQNKIKKLQDQVKHKSTHYRKGRYPLKTINNLNNKIDKNLNKLFNLSKRNLQDIKNKDNKKLMKDYNKIVNKYNKPIEKIDNRNKQLEKQILELENEIKKNNIQAPKKIMQEKKVINYTFNVNLYRKINENDNEKRNHPRLEVENEIDGEGNMYLIDRKIVGIHTTNNKLNLEEDVFYNIVDNSQKVINDIMDFLENNADETQERVINQAKGYTDGIMIKDLDIREEIVHVPVNIEHIKFKYDTINTGIYSKYTKYSINADAKNFKSLIEEEVTNDYLKNNKRVNCCFLTAIINKFYNRFNAIKSDGKRAFKELTYDFLCSFLKLENKPDNIECSIAQAKPFFEKYDTNLYVYDVYLNLIYKYQTQKESYYSLYLIAKGNH